MRCPHCEGLNTKRNGKTRSAPRGLDGPTRPLQRFLCKDCSKSFTRQRTSARPGARFTDPVVREAVRLYVQGLPSYRVLAALLDERLGVSPSPRMLNRWVDETGARVPTPLEVSSQLRPQWGGVLGVDGKAIWVRGEERCLLLAVDQATQDVVHRLVLETETAEAFHRLVHEAIVDGGYRLRGLVIDGVPGWVRVWGEHFGGVPLQLCRIHAERRVDRQIPKLSRSPKAGLQAELKDCVRAVLYAGDYDTACRRYRQLTADPERFARVATRHSGIDVIGSLRSTFGLYMTHHHVEGIPADSNVTENVIRQLNKKLRLMEGFATLDSAERFTRLLVGCYRFKRFTDSCTDERNGRSPLELAGVNHDDVDWLDFLLDL